MVPIFALVTGWISLCLSGLLWIHVSSTLSSVSWKRWSKALQDQEERQHQLELQWADTYHKLRNIAGRMARLSRRQQDQEIEQFDQKEPPAPLAPAMTLQDIQKHIASQVIGREIA